MISASMGRPSKSNESNDAFRNVSSLLDPKMSESNEPMLLRFAIVLLRSLTKSVFCKSSKLLGPVEINAVRSVNQRIVC